MKYYTPKIEEFHVGFECEFKSYKNDGKGNFIEQWDKRVIGLHTFKESSYEQITYDSNWRVKYLDEQDILDLGFIKKSFNYNNFLESFCEVYENIDLNIVIGHYININKISVITRDTLSSKNEAVKRGYLENPTVNLIIIKNNEFKKLLTQLEITI